MYRLCMNMYSTLLDCTLSLPLMKEAAATPGVVMLDELWVNSGLGGRRPLFLPQGSEDSRPSRWMLRQDRPAEGQLVKHPAVPPCHTHKKCELPHSLHPATSRHRTLTSATTFIPSVYSSTLQDQISNVACFSTFSSNCIRFYSTNHFLKDAVVL